MRFGKWLWYQWDMSNGKLLRVRYAVGKLHKVMFGYDPDSDRWPHRLAHYMGLIGYNPSRMGWAKRFVDLHTPVSR